MTEGNGGSEFLIDLSPQEVRQKVDRYMLDWGFSIGLNRTAGTTEYGVVRQKRFPARLLAISPDFYRVRVSIRKEETGGTRLTIKTLQKGRRWPDVQSELEQWIADELGGTPRSR